MKDINVKALFLGPKSENEEILKQNISTLCEDHFKWRKKVNPDDDGIITKEDKNSEDFKYTNSRIENTVKELSNRLMEKSVPWQSPRYLGHMASETLMSAVLGYFGAMLYNSNNVSYESSPATSEFEDEVKDDFCNLIGYDKNIGWGHICSGGSVANMEGIWYARNLKSIPLAIKEVQGDLVRGKSDWELLNMSTKDTLDLLDKVLDKLDDVKKHSSRGDASKNLKLGKLIVPDTKHYSWLKAADVMGIGTDNVIKVKVDSLYRMDMNALKEIIDDLASKKIPILAVVGVVGTTEEGAVDHIDKIVELREEYSKKGVNFYLHIDAAYGGYARSIFLNTNHEFMEYEELHSRYLESKVFKNPELNWPSYDVYNGFKAMSEADSVTIDPHKMGYIPFSAGGVVIKDKRMTNAISYFASYAFENDEEIPVLLGAFIFEGSKSGATAAAVWSAHRTLPLNISGYGKVIGATIEGANNLYNNLISHREYKVLGKTVEVIPLVSPDFNMVDFAFNIKGNKDLEVMNELNRKFYKEASFTSDKVQASDFLTSHTELEISEYGSSPINFIEKFGIDKSEWQRYGKITVLRACVVTPFINDKEVFDEYIKKIHAAIQNKLEKILLKDEVLV